VEHNRLWQSNLAQPQRSMRYVTAEFGNVRHVRTGSPGIVGGCVAPGPSYREDSVRVFLNIESHPELNAADAINMLKRDGAPPAHSIATVQRDLLLMKRHFDGSALHRYR
jgi:hypothetical protein